MHANLFPNPANQFVTISTSAVAETIVITDAVGREVYSEKPTSQQTQIDVSDFQKEFIL